MNLRQQGMMLLDKAAASGESFFYLNACRLLMLDYNQEPSKEKFDFLRELAYEPNKAALQANFERARQGLTAELRSTVPHYDDLPIIIFPLIENYGVPFSKSSREFLLITQENRRHNIYQKMASGTVAADNLERELRNAFRRELVQELVAELEKFTVVGKYDEDFAAYLTELQRLATDKAPCFYFAARRDLARQDFTAALENAERAYKLRKVNTAVWLLLADCHTAVGDVAAATKFRLLAQIYAGVPISGLPSLADERAKSAAIAARLNVGHAPFYEEVLPPKQVQRNKIFGKFKSAHGEFLPDQDDEASKYWCGVYNNTAIMDYEAKKLTAAESLPLTSARQYNNYIFDLMKGDLTRQAKITVRDGEKIILPLAGTADGQELSITDDNNQGQVRLGKEEWSFFRFESTAQITSAHPFAVAAPIKLSHNPKRKKLILNLLLDGLSWGAMKQDNFRAVPNLRKFFRRGVTFQNNYSPAEYTYPSLAMIETGVYMGRTQIFHDSVPVHLEREYVTLSELAKNHGYYCADLMDDSRGLYNRLLRGMDRQIVNPYIAHPAHEGVRRTIDHLDAFRDMDNYVFVHVSDPHPFGLLVPMSPYTQTHMPWSKFTLGESALQAAVFLPGNELFCHDNLYLVKRMDDELGKLFDYIENNYREDEYLVSAYSDHGVSVYTDDRWMFTEEQCGAALMLRGCGVPSVGDAEELTSSMDLYAILLKLLAWQSPSYKLDANLPQIFGGKKREFVISNSIYPEQTYKLGIRSDKYEFRLETKEKTRQDGTVCLEPFTYRIFTRDQKRVAVLDDNIKDYFLQIAYEHTKNLDYRQEFMSKSVPHC